MPTECMHHRHAILDHCVKCGVTLTVTLAPLPAPPVVTFVATMEKGS